MISFSWRAAGRALAVAWYRGRGIYVQSLVATQQHNAQVVPGVKQHGYDQSTGAEFPDPAEQQRRYSGKKHPDGALMQGMHAAENECHHDIGQTEAPDTCRETCVKPVLQTVAEHRLLNDWRDYQQSKQSDRRTSGALKAEAGLAHQPGTRRSAHHNERVSREYEFAGRFGRSSHGLRMIAAMLLLPPVGATYAGLGEAESSIHADQIRMGARHSVSVTPQYLVHDLHASDGTLVRQYVTANGLVFAVTWKSLSKPDFAGFLGLSYPLYAASAQVAARRPGVQRHFRHDGLDLVVQSTAHLNVYSGFAFRRSMLPKGLSLDYVGLQ